MQNNYYFLRQLTKALESKIVGLKLMESFSQEKDELVLGFAAARGKKKNYKEFFIKAIIYPDFSCLYFPEQFERARKNSADLFAQLIDCEVVSIRQFLNERCFAINFDNNFTLVFKLYTNRSNVILFQNDEVIEMFHSRIVADNQLKISALDRPIEQTEEAFRNANNEYKKVFPTFGKVVSEYLSAEFAQKDKWSFIQETLLKLESPHYYITKINHQTHLALLPIGDIMQTFDEPIAAMNAFYVSFTKVSTLEQEKATILRKLTKELRQTESYLQQNYDRLGTIENAVKNEELGHILMANLYEIPEKSASIELFDFYRNEQISIKLKPDLSPQRNAENYYRKSKNEKIELDKIQENILNREGFLEKLRQKIQEIEAIETLKEFRNYLKINKLNSVSKEIATQSLFKKYDCEGFEIWIGKNAKNNDLLTQQYAYKEDLWLHARDAQGSHVVVKYQAGKKFPNTVIERAASLAAYYSKRRNETLAAVIVTPKKFVRKPKGFADGMVIVEKESVVMVEPHQ